MSYKYVVCTFIAFSKDKLKCQFVLTSLKFEITRAVRPEIK